MTVAPATAATPTGASLTSTAPTRTATKTFDSGMFLNLLVTQLRNQDPSSPMDSTQMISQTSQLASMEQLTSLTKTSTDGYTLQMRSAAANILGRSVSYTSADGVPKTGVASAVSFSGDTPMVTVGSDTVDFATLTGLATATARRDHRARILTRELGARRFAAAGPIRSTLQRTEVSRGSGGNQP